jgi:hypothetical protein
MVPGGAGTLVMQWQVQGGAESVATTAKLQCSDNECSDGNCTDGDGAYYDVDATTGAELVNVHGAFPGTYADTDPIASTLLGSPGSGSFVTGRFHSSAVLGAPAQRSQNAFTEEAYSLALSPTATPGTQIACRVTLSNGTMMAGPPALIQVQSGMAFGGP